MTFERDNKIHFQETIHTICKQDTAETSAHECSSRDFNLQINSLQQSIALLVKDASQIFEDIAAIAVAAQISLETSGKYQYYLDSLKHHIAMLEDIGITINQSNTELEKLMHAASELSKIEALDVCELSEELVAQEVCEQTACDEQEGCKQVECEPEAEQVFKTCTRCETSNLDKHEYCFKCGTKFSIMSCNDNICDISDQSPKVDLLQNYLQQ